MNLKTLILSICLISLASCVTESKSLITEPSKDRKERATNHIELAGGYIKLNRLGIAADEIEKALAIDSKNPQAHHMSAVLSMKIGEFDQAETSFRNALKYDGTNAPTAHELGLLLCRQGKPEQGLVYLNQALNNQFFERRGLSALRAGECIGKTNPVVARGYFDKALSLNPNLDVAMYRTAEVLYIEGFPIKARAYYERYMYGRKQSAQTLLLGYRIEQKAKANAEANSYAEQLLKDFKNSKEAKILQGLVEQQG